jgi:hypothetical protein
MDSLCVASLAMHLSASRVCDRRLDLIEAPNKIDAGNDPASCDPGDCHSRSKEKHMNYCEI